MSIKFVSNVTIPVKAAPLEGLAVNAILVPMRLQLSDTKIFLHYPLSVNAEQAFTILKMMQSVESATIRVKNAWLLLLSAQYVRRLI